MEWQTFGLIVASFKVIWAINELLLPEMVKIVLSIAIAKPSAPSPKNHEKLSVSPKQTNQKGRSTRIIDQLHGKITQVCVGKVRSHLHPLCKPESKISLPK
ncbi:MULTISPECIES: hypothetical protein [Nostoc]|uniref:Transposase n=1 Tax=Nostoc paludosum FACHB-159 TaxID=2692908 RepID=A0ABR8KCJ2_9NOSO|nr:MULTISPECIES: hypothetical protein [Nostoc]MBD2679389.1 hypothetical protein [Nostoc sp. FACHB-857]MBD2737254.1 hypothetical protein [Nostoc paludosum FACHB-159]